MEDSVRWSVKVSRETDLALRNYLGARGMRKGDLSKFIVQAVEDHLFHRTVADIKSRNASTNQVQLQSEIDQAVREVRREARMESARHSKRRFVK